MDYKKRVLELEKEGMTTSDAQSVADAEFNKMIFTPLSKDGKTRLRFQVRPYTPHRGELGKVFTVVTVKGKRLKAKVVSCGLGRCLCDARLI